MSDTHFKIVTSMYNVEDWIKRTASSIKNQNYTNFQCVFIDDASTDRTVEILESLVGDDERFAVLKNSDKKYSLGRINQGIEHASPADEDIILSVDGDDWLATKNVLTYLDEFYKKEQCWMTYGSYMEYPTGMKGIEASAYSPEVVQNNTYRTDRWRASHLRTFKYKLWKNIEKEDLLDWNGNFFKTTIDKAFMYPMLEMAGPRAKYIDETLYVYNLTNPLNVHKSRRELQLKTNDYLRGKEAYDRKDILH